MPQWKAGHAWWDSTKRQGQPRRASRSKGAKEARSQDMSVPPAMCSSVDAVMCKCMGSNYATLPSTGFENILIDRYTVALVYV